MPARNVDRFARITGRRHEIGGQEDPADALAVLHGRDDRRLVSQRTVGVGARNEIRGLGLVEKFADERCCVGSVDEGGCNEYRRDRHEARAMKSLHQSLKPRGMSVFPLDINVSSGNSGRGPDEFAISQSKPRKGWLGRSIARSGEIAVFFAVAQNDALPAA